jgi:hypothetical protein
VVAGVLLITSALGPASARATYRTPVGSGSVGPSPAPTAEPVRWHDGRCATGAIGPLERDAQNRVIMPAVIALCGPWLAKYSFTMVAFRADRPTTLAYGSRLRHYRPDEPTTVRATFQTVPARGPVGVCLMRSPAVRLACIRLDIPANQQMTATPLPVDDPLVNRPVVYVDDAPEPVPGSGFCATCLDIPS